MLFSTLCIWRMELEQGFLFPSTGKTRFLQNMFTHKFPIFFLFFLDYCLELKKLTLGTNNYNNLRAIIITNSFRLTMRDSFYWLISFGNDWFIVDLVQVILFAFFDKFWQELFWLYEPYTFWKSNLVFLTKEILLGKNDLRVSFKTI